MSDIIADISLWIGTNWSLILFIIGGVIFTIWYLGKPTQQEKYKKKDIEKEIKKYMANIFSLTEENIGYGKTLYIGSRDAGFILKSIHINQYEKVTDTVRIAYLKKKMPEGTELIEETNKDMKILYKALGFSVCRRGRISRIMAQLGFGVEYFIVETCLVSEHETTFNINAYSQPVKTCGIWIFSNVGRTMIDEIAYKITDEQRLEAMINTIPRSLFISDLDHAKEKSGLDILEDVRKGKRAEELERLKKD